MALLSARLPRFYESPSGQQSGVLSHGEWTCCQNPASATRSDAPDTGRSACDYGAARVLGHLRAFWTLAFVELWERFGFYLMMSLLVLYMNERWQLTEAEAMKWFILHHGGVFSPLIRWIHRGAWAEPSDLGGDGRGAAVRRILRVWRLRPKRRCRCGLGCSVLGNGLFKPNIATLVEPCTLRETRDETAHFPTSIWRSTSVVQSPLIGGFLRVHMAGASRFRRQAQG